MAELSRRDIGQHGDAGRSGNAPRWRFRAVALLAVAIAGCQNFPKAPASDFVAAANALARAESDYFDQIQAASDNSHVLIASEFYVSHSQDWAKLADELTRRDDFSKARAARIAAMTQLQNYAQQIAAITAEATGDQIAKDAKATATGTTTLLQGTGVKLSAAQAGLLQNAVGALASAIENAAAARELQTLAREASRPIGDIATMIAKDNAILEQDNFVAGLLRDQQDAMLDLLDRVYAERGITASERFGVVMAWRDWKPALVNKAKDIDAALAKLVKANEALARKQEFSAGALAQQALADAEQALGVKVDAK